MCIVHRPQTTPRKKVDLFQTHEQDETIFAQEVQGDEEEEEEQKVTTNLPEEEYDTDSDSEHEHWKMIMMRLSHSRRQLPLLHTTSELKQSKASKSLPKKILLFK